MNHSSVSIPLFGVKCFHVKLRSLSVSRQPQEEKSDWKYSLKHKDELNCVHLHQEVKEQFTETTGGI